MLDADQDARMIARCTVLEAFLDEAPDALRETLFMREAFSVSAYYLPAGGELGFEPSPEVDRLHIVLDGRCALVMGQTRLNVERGNALGIGAPGAHRVEALDEGVAFLTLAMRRLPQEEAPSGDLTIMKLLGGARLGARERLAAWAARPSLGGRVSLLTPDLHPPGPLRIFASSERLFVVLEGPLKIEVQGALHSVEGPGLFLIPPDTPHRIVGEGEKEVTALSISDPEPASALTAHFSCGHRARWCDLIRFQDDAYLRLSSEGIVEEMNRAARTLLNLPDPSWRGPLRDHLLPRDASWLDARLKDPFPGTPARSMWALPHSEEGLLQVLFVPFQGDTRLHSAILVMRPFPSARASDEAAREIGDASSGRASPEPNVSFEAVEKGERETLARRFIATSPSMLALTRALESLAETRDWIILWGPRGSGRSASAYYVHALNPGPRDAFRVLKCASMPASKLQALLVEDAGSGVSAPGPWLRALDDATLLVTGLETYKAMERKHIFQALTRLRATSDIRTRLILRLDKRPHKGLPSSAPGPFPRRGPFAVLEVPALADRPEDIPLLLQHFMEDFTDASAVPALSSEALEELLNGPIPENLIGLKRLARSLTANKLEGSIKASTLRTLLARPKAPEWLENASSIPTLAEAERLLVLRALKAHGGNKAKAARALDIPRARFYRMMTEHGVEG